MLPTTGASSHPHDHDLLHIQANSPTALSAARHDGKKHLLLAATGSVATIKIPLIIRGLAAHDDLSIRVVLTDAARHFLGGQSAEQPAASDLLRLPRVDAVYADAAEWGPQPWRRGSPVLHIELRRWADVLVVAPLSANSLAKIVNGLSDNLLLSYIRAWDTDGSVDGKRKRILVAPAMNTAMWKHPVTARQMSVLEDDWGVKEQKPAPKDDNDDDDDGQASAAAPEQQQQGWFEVIRPISKGLACGDTGDGAMASVDTILRAIEERLGLGA